MGSGVLDDRFLSYSYDLLLGAAENVDSVVFICIYSGVAIFIDCLLWSARTYDVLPAVPVAVDFHSLTASLLRGGEMDY